MAFLYNCRHDGDQYRISKFDSAMNIESSYLCTLLECECPAGVRPTCRHRAMLSKFIAEGHISDGYFHDFDRNGWVQMDVMDQLVASAARTTQDEPSLKEVVRIMLEQPPFETTIVGEPRHINRRGR